MSRLLLAFALFIATTAAFTFNWQACPPRTPFDTKFVPRQAPRSTSNEEDKVNAWCSTQMLTLNRENPQSVNIPIFVKRISSKASTTFTKQFWMVYGGPGSSDYALEETAFLFALEHPEAEIYLPDHRGTGRSTFLSCAALQMQLPACIAHYAGIFGNDIVAFRTTQAAYDVIEMMEKVKNTTSEQEIYLYGISYGTYYVNRILQLAPSDLIKASIIDGVLAPVVGRPNNVYDRVNYGALTLLEKCKVDALCSSKLTNDPVNFTRQVLDKLSAGFCSAVTNFGGPGDDLYTLKNILGGLIIAVPPAYTAMIYRLNRCDQNDSVWISAMITYFLGVLGGPPGNPDATADFLFNHISRNELWDFSISKQTSQDNMKKSLAWADVNPAYDGIGLWPFIYNESLAEEYTSADVGPILILNGDLDMQTGANWARNYSVNSPAETTLFIIPNTGHGTVVHQVLKPGLTPNRTCGFRLTSQWISGDFNPVTTNNPCMADVGVMDFTGEYYYKFFGADFPYDMYENVAKPITSSSSELTSAATSQGTSSSSQQTSAASSTAPGTSSSQETTSAAWSLSVGSFFGILCFIRLW